MKDIFRKHIINKDNFGKLFILSNGDIYANILHKNWEISNRFNLSNRKKEIEIGESWLRIRNQNHAAIVCINIFVLHLLT